MSYLPLARKYRPQTFSDLIGQSHVTTTLARALETKRIGQAYLFTGLRGVGKTSGARILAKCLNCANGPTATPCNVCTNCTQITQGNNLDVIEIDGASNRGIDEIRNLRDTVPFAPASGSFRVYIIDEVHMLTTEAFNALLKTLEEPPAHVKFIFATTTPNKVPATILSRCQRFDFRRLEPPTVVAMLKRIATAEKIRIDEPALYAVARAADGSLRDAEVILEQLISFVDGPISEAHVTQLLGAIESVAVMTLTQALLDHDAPKALTVVTEQLECGKDSVQILTGLLRHIRNLLVLSSVQETASRDDLIPRLIDEPTEHLKQLTEQASRSTPQELLTILQLLIGAYEMVRRSPMAHTILELVTIKLATREQWQSLEAITRQLEQLTQRPAASPPERAEASRSVTGTPHPSVTSPAAGRCVEHAQPSATPVPSPASAPEQLTSMWTVFLERLGKQKMSLAAYLMHAKPLQLDGGILTVGLAGFSLHQEVLSLAENRRLIDQLLTELCQTKVTVQYATLPEPVEPSSQATIHESSSTPLPTPSLVQDIVSLFNATVMTPPPPPQ